MSSPRYDWWSYVKSMIRRYPDLKQQYEALHEIRITAQITGMPRGNNVSNPTANAALRELSPVNQKEFEAVHKAVETTRGYKDGVDRLKVIELVFWERSHTLAGAAMRVSCSYDTAKNWHREFIRLTAFLFGLLPEQEYAELKSLP